MLGAGIFLIIFGVIFLLCGLGSLSDYDAGGFLPAIIGIIMLAYGISMVAVPQPMNDTTIKHQVEQPFHHKLSVTDVVDRGHKVKITVATPHGTLVACTAPVKIVNGQHRLDDEQLPHHCYDAVLAASQ
jgi:hypothetical protein